MKAGNREGLKLSQLRALVAVADHLNFGKASLHLQISQSAVSHAIASLEDQLGIILLSRGRYGARLTPAGETIVAHARQILQLSDDIFKEADLAKGLEGGIVRIASFRSLATHLLPKAIAKFKQRFPAVNVTISEYIEQAEAEQDLREGRADIGLIRLPDSPEFEAWELFRDQYIALFPPKSKALEEPLTWERLTTYPMILPPKNDSCCQFLLAHLAKFGKTLKVAYEVKEDSTIVSMVRQGLGATVLPRLGAAPIPTELRVYSLPVPLERVIGVVILADALQPPPVFAFLDTLKAFVKAQEQ